MDEAANSRLIPTSERGFTRDYCTLCRTSETMNGTDASDVKTPHVEADRPYVHIHRPAITQGAFDEIYQRNESRKPIKECMKNYIRSKCECSKTCLKNQLFSWLPFLHVLMTYRKSFIVGDVISGLSVGVVHVPQGMGFALLAAVKPVFGLYSSFFPNIVYFFLGTSRHASVGTMALISLMVGAVVEREIEAYKNANPVGSVTITVSMMSESTNTTANPTDEEDMRRIGIAASVTLLAGLIQIVMGITNLGAAIIRYMSAPFVGGFTTGAACQILTSQLRFVLGLTLPRHSGALQLPKTYVSIFENITQTNIASLIIGIISITFLTIVKEGINENCKSKLKVPIPAELLVVIGGTLISYYAKLNENYKVKIVGPIPKGFPSPQVPDLSNAQNYIVDAILIALVGFAISISMAKLYMLKYEYTVDTNQEVFAYGSLHTFSSFFLCFAGAVAPPRCTVHDSTGGKTQVASLISCVLLLVVILFIGPYFATLPNSALASIIIVALIPMFKQFRNLKMLWRVNRWDCLIWLVAWLSVTLLDVVMGLAVGMGFSLLTILIQTQLAKTERLTPTDSLDQFTGEDRIQTSDFPGIKIYRYQGMLCYTNAESLKDIISEGISRREEQSKGTKRNENCEMKENKLSTVFSIKKSMVLESNPDEQINGKDVMVNNNTQQNAIVDTSDGESVDRTVVSTIIIDFTSMTYVDVVGLNTIKQIGKMCKKTDTVLLLAGCNNSFVAKLSACEFLTKDNRHNIFPSVQDAMAYAMNPQNMSASMDAVVTRM